MPDRFVNFASDNVAGADAEIMDALVEAARTPAMPYGDDPYSARLRTVAAEVFEREVEIYPVATGGAANSLALATLSPPYGVVFCHENAHIEEDECGGPEFYMGGGKLTLLAGPGAKVQAQDLAEKLGEDSPAPQVHRAQPAAVSITQATEQGAVYELAEVSEIAQICRTHGLPLHMDGARLGNAIAALGCTPAEATWKAGVDVLSFGATKNGALAAEAVVFFNPDAVADFEFRRKRGGHLFSKMRFLSAQMLAYLADERWLRNAANANRTARDLAEGLAGLDAVSLWSPVAANMMFVTMPVRMAETLEQAGCVFYRWGSRDDLCSARLVTSFETTDEEVALFLEAARRGAGRNDA